MIAFLVIIVPSIVAILVVVVPAVILPIVPPMAAAGSLRLFIFGEVTVLLASGAQL